MTLNRRASRLLARIRIGAPPPTAHAESEQHESGRQPAARGFQFRIGENIFVRQNVEPSHARAEQEENSEDDGSDSNEGLHG
jgi:hypothetical protein